MTVAVGLVCHNGVVLAADTEVTYLGGTGKRNESKIFPINREAGCYLTYTGDPEFAKELVDRLRDRIKNNCDPEMIKVAMQSEYRDMLNEERVAGGDATVPAWFLLTVRTDIRTQGKIHDYKTDLYNARGNRFFRVDRYAALGIGEEMATAVFEPLYLALSTRENVYIATYAIQKVKRAIQGVGGTTTIIEVRNDDSIPFADFGAEEVRRMEDEFDFLDNALRPLLIAFPGEMTTENFNATLQHLGERLRKRRAERGKILEA
jgi:20S proteasome alpha/beta subunit